MHHLEQKNQEMGDLPKRYVSDQSYSDLLAAFIKSAVRFARTSNELDIYEAWKLFRVWQEARLDPESEDWQLFLTWYVFHWKAELPNNLVKTTIANKFITAARNIFTSEELQIIESCCKTNLDFYEVHELPEFGFFYVKSLLLGYQYGYRFDQLPDDLKAGDIFLGKFAHIVDDRGVILAKSRSFGQDAKILIGNLRINLIKSRREDFIQDFSTFDSDIFNVYFDLMDGF